MEIGDGVGIPTRLKIRVSSSNPTEVDGGVITSLREPDQGVTARRGVPRGGPVRVDPPEEKGARVGHGSCRRPDFPPLELSASTCRRQRGVLRE